MTGFMLYAVGFLITWYLGARALYNSEFVKDLADGLGEAAAMSLFFAGAVSVMWPLTLPFILVFYLVAFVSKVYGSTLTNSLDKLLDNDKQ
jgi:O-antigen ligase